MSRIPQVTATETTNESKALLDAAQKRLGMVPNVFRAMAHSPAVLGSFMNLLEAMETATLDRKFQQQIAVAVAQTNASSYCLAVNTAIGASVGLTQEEMIASRQLQDSNPKIAAGLKFVRAVVDGRGQISDAQFQALQSAGYTNEEIAEILGNISLQMFANYFNLVSQTEPDFPSVSLNLS
jgi:uncharacterized peroxidase-related enzyme